MRGDTECGAVPTLVIRRGSIILSPGLRHRFDTADLGMKMGGFWQQMHPGDRSNDFFVTSDKKVNAELRTVDSPAVKP